MSADPVMDQVMAALAAQARDGAEATRGRLIGIAAEIGADGDPLVRCVVGHYLADLEAEPAKALAWDLLALEAAADLTDERLQIFNPSLTVAGFMPSLHLNVAQNCHRVGQIEAAREAIASARAGLGALPDDGYGKMIRGGVERLEAKLALG